MKNVKLNSYFQLEFHFTNPNKERKCPHFSNPKIFLFFCKIHSVSIHLSLPECFLQTPVMCCGALKAYKVVNIQ